MKKSTFLPLLLLCAFFACKPGTKNNDNGDNHDDGTSTTDTTEVIQDNNEDEPQYLIEPTSFMGISPGDKISEIEVDLEKTILETGDGDFDVYDIKLEDGTKMGYIHPDYSDESLVGDIVVESELGETKKA